MGITLKTSERELNKKFKEAEQSIINNIVRVLRYCGEMAVNEARNNGNYKDQTGNLRNSIGYVIAINGKILENGFSNGSYTRTKKDGTADMRFKISQKEWKEGKKIGYDLALQIAKETPEISLVVVAGMKYASHVESKGINVLTSAENMAKRIIPELLSKLK